MHNITSYLYEMSHHSVFEESNLKISDAGVSLCIEDLTCIDEPLKDSLANVQVHFLPCDPTYLFTKKRTNFEGFFDRIFISNSLAHRVADAASLLKPESGLMIAETAQ